MEESNTSAEFGGTNGKASRQTDAFSFYPIWILARIPQCWKKLKSTQMHPIWDDIVLSTLSYIIMYFMYPGVQKTHFFHTIHFDLYGGCNLWPHTYKTTDSNTHTSVRNWWWYTHIKPMTNNEYKALILTYILDKVGCKCWQVGVTELLIVMHQ
jgi:hypothetical protein